jgi:hypothetical protein
METTKQKTLRLKLRKLTEKVIEAKHKREMFLIDNRMWDYMTESEKKKLN